MSPPTLLLAKIVTDWQVLFAPGWAFDAHGEHAIGGDGVGYFRLAYSTTTYEQTREAITTFSKVLTKFMKVQ
jgi:aromatic amino acid aminotransferase I